MEEVFFLSHHRKALCVQLSIEHHRDMAQETQSLEFATDGEVKDQTHGRRSSISHNYNNRLQPMQDGKPKLQTILQLVLESKAEAAARTF